MKKILLSIFLLGQLLIPNFAQAVSSHPIGTNIIDSKGTVYRIQSGIIGFRDPYTSAGAFLSYKFNKFSTVQKANSADMALDSDQQDTTPVYIGPRPGSLINDHGTVYLITSPTQKLGFASEAAFTGMGYSFKYVYPGDTSFMESAATITNSNRQHDSGTLINDHGTLYILAPECKLGVPSMAVLDSWGYWPEDAVKANTYDSAYSNGGALKTRQAYELNIFDSSLARCAGSTTDQLIDFNTQTNNIKLSYPSNWKSTTSGNYPSEYKLQPSDKATTTGTENSIVLNYTGHCMNTQCLTIFTLEQMIDELGQKIIKPVTINGISGYYVSTSTGYAYEFVVGDDFITVSTDIYKTKLDEFIQSLKITPLVVALK